MYDVLDGHVLPQAAADARSAEDAQTAWLLANMSPLFGRRLLRMVRDIAKHIVPQTGNPQNTFPLLAGSHLSQAGGLHAAFLFMD